MVGSCLLETRRNPRDEASPHSRVRRVGFEMAQEVGPFLVERIPQLDIELHRAPGARG